MKPWSEYLRTQAVLADRISKTMTTAAMVKEFADYAEGYRRDADAEDADRSQAGSQDSVAQPACAEATRSRRALVRLRVGQCIKIFADRTGPQIRIAENEVARVRAEFEE
jgi:hypothetical protein